MYAIKSACVKERIFSSGPKMVRPNPVPDAGLGVRVVSMPSADVFLAQDAAYRESVLPAGCRARVAVEAAHPDYWCKFVGLDGAVVGIDRFGLSAPGPVAMAELGMTLENVVAAAKRVAAA